MHMMLCSSFSDSNTRGVTTCVLEFQQKWDDCLSLAEFSYNNSYQESIKMAPLRHCTDDDVEYP
jgi:hypothetical protein